MTPYSLNEARLDQFERYFRHQMAPDESIGFQQELIENKELAAAYDDYLVSREVIEQKIQATLRNQLKEWHQSTLVNQPPLISEKPVAPSVVRSIKWVRWAAAASILFMLGLGYSKYQFVKNYADKLSIDHLDVSYNQLRSGESVPSVINNALKKYSNDFEKAIDELEKIDPSTGNSYFEAQCYIGKMYAQMGRCTEAERAYSKAGPIAEPIKPISDLICMIKNGQAATPEFKSRLDEILKDPNHMNYKDAQEIKNITEGYWWRVFNK